MTSLILQPPLSMTAPLPGTPYLPDIDSGLFIDLKASDLALANGDAVGTWIATGFAPLADRTFNKQYGDEVTWGFPTFSAAGGPLGGKAVTFNRSQRIANTSLASLVPIERVIAQPTSYALVCKSNDFAGNTGDTRIIAGSTGNLQNVRPMTGLGSFNVGAGTDVGRTVSAGGASWMAIIISFNGANTKVKLGGDEISTINANTNGYRGLFLGVRAAFSIAPGSGWDGALAEMRMYNRALSESDIAALHFSLAQTYGVP